MNGIKYLILSTVFIISACASTDKIHYQPEIQTLDKPIIGEITKAGLGDPLVVQGRQLISDAVVFPGAIIFKGTTEALLPSGTYVKIYETEVAEFFRPLSKTELNSPDHIVLEIMIRKDGAKYIFMKTSKTYLVSDQAKFERRKVVVSEENSLQQTLIYSGRIGNKLNIDYREIYSGRARPAFDNRVEYNLDDSKIIGYKGARIEVLDANNQQITYRLLKNFENPK